MQLKILNKKKNEEKLISLDLNGNYQKKNILTVLTALDLLKNNFSLEEEKIIISPQQCKKTNGPFWTMGNHS